MQMVDDSHEKTNSKLKAKAQDREVQSKSLEKKMQKNESKWERKIVHSFEL